MQRKAKLAAVFLLPIGGILVNAARAEYLEPRDAGAHEFLRAAPSPLRIRADLSDKILYVERDGKVVKAYTFASGTPKYPTPRGTFKIDKVVWNPAWIPPDSKWAKGRKPKDAGDPTNPMQLVKIFFLEPDYYIHGTDQVESIGSAASHGCIRLDPVDAAELAIRVMESSGAQRDSTWYQNAIERGETRTVMLPRKVEMIITN
jgi:lipoprotein-anchoring transpeptidase ErfK/SrfK